MSNPVLLDILVRQALAMRELADGVLANVAAIRGDTVTSPTPEAESALQKVTKTFGETLENPS